jgi:hypothetical protein
MDQFLGHGYQVWRSFVLLVAVYVCCAAIFINAKQDRGVVPADSTSGAVATACTSVYPCFNPAAYSFDIVIPLINLGQESAWRPDPAAANGQLYEVTAISGRIAGWILSTLSLPG